MNPYMQAAGWGPIGTEAFDLQDANDRTTMVPASTRFMRYQGTQLHNGVSQLSSGFLTGGASVGALPYWQQQDKTNPPILLRGGGAAATPVAVMNIEEMKRPSVLRLRDVMAVARRRR